MSDADRIRSLAARIGELERRVDEGRHPLLGRRAFASTSARRFIAVALVAALLIPGVALASHQFSDVTTSNPFHADISALAESGVTSGCGNGKFCPKDYVTREQMAAFLNRLGALSSSKQPVVNANRLDGLDSTAFTTRAFGTMRPDECFQANGACTMYWSTGINSIRRVATGTYCVEPRAGRSFRYATPALTTDDNNSGPANGFGIPIVAYSSLQGQCADDEVRVLTYRASGAPLTIALSNNTSFGIVIP